MFDFLWRALFAGLVVAAIAGPLGCFVVWRRMSYFGDTLAHSALLGIAIGLLLDTNLQSAVIVASILLALLLGFMEGKSRIASDTLLGILAHSALALGLVVLHFSPTNIDLMGYLFGDLLSVSSQDLLWITVTATGIGATLFVFWKPLLNLTLHEELARVEGLNVDRFRLLLLIMVALLVAVSMKIVGVLLITALLIIPPAAARSFSRSPASMALSASVIGALSIVLGMAASWFRDTPTGPSIVLAATLIFIVTSSVNRLRS